MKNLSILRNHNSFTLKGWRAAALVVIHILILLLISSVPSTGATAPRETALRSTLPNGLRVIIVRNNLAPVVTTVVNYLVGSREEPAEFPGMAHAQEHMMFRGSPGLSGDQLTHIMASLGGMASAHTLHTVTQYILTVPSQDLDIALHIEAVRMRGVTDSHRAWCTERGAIEREVAEDASTPQYVSNEEVLAHMFEGTPYAHHPMGTAASFDKMTGAMLKKFHDTWYGPNNAVLVIAGNVEPRKALGRVRKFFGAIPRKDIPKRQEVCPQPVKPDTLHFKTDQSYGLVTVSFPMPGSDSPDYPASLILVDIMSSQRGSLFSLVPEGKAFYAKFTLNPLPCAGTGHAVAAFPMGGDGAALAREIEHIIAEETRKGLSSDLLEASKRILLTRAELQKNSIQGLAMAWSETIAVNNRRSPEDDMKVLKRVSVDDVNRVARKYLDPDHAIISILTPEPSGKPSVSPASPPVKTAESFAPDEAKVVKLPDWATKAVIRLTIPAFVVKPFAVTLSNRIRLVVQPIKANNTVSLYGYVSNSPEKEVPPGKEGVDQALSQLFAYGATTLDRLAFQKALDDIGARESAGVRFTLQVLVNHFEQGVSLLADNQLRPALPEEGFNTVRKQLAEAVAGKLQSPDHLARHALRSALFPTYDPGLRRATVETVSSLTLADVRDYYKKVFRPDLTTIVIVGKITPGRARAAIEKYFGSWKAEGPRPDLWLPHVPPNKSSSTYVPDTSRTQAEVTLAETIGAPRSYPDFYALMLGNYVLGSSSCGTRLYRELREEEGLVYYVYSSLRIRKTRSTYQVKYGCSPANVAKVRSIVERDLRTMQTTFVSNADLERAKALLLREMALAESSVDRIAASLSFRAAHDPPLEDPIEAAQRYIKLTPEQVRDAFVKWIRPSDLVEVIKGPPR